MTRSLAPFYIAVQYANMDKISWTSSRARRHPYEPVVTKYPSVPFSGWSNFSMPSGGLSTLFRWALDPRDIEF